IIVPVVCDNRSVAVEGTGAAERYRAPFTARVGTTRDGGRQLVGRTDHSGGNEQHIIDVGNFGRVVGLGAKADLEIRDEIRPLNLNCFVMPDVFLVVVATQASDFAPRSVKDIYRQILILVEAARDEPREAE